MARNSLRARIRTLVYKGHLTQEEGDRIRQSLKKTEYGQLVEWISYENHDGYYSYVSYCGACKGRLYVTDGLQKYCPWCGQKVKWVINDDK